MLLLLLLSHFSRVQPVQPHKQQSTSLPRPWNSPGKNTGVGCHFLLQCIKVKSETEVAQSCPTLRDPMDCTPPGSSIHGIFHATVLEWGAIAFSSGYIPDPGIEPASPALKADSLLSVPPGKPLFTHKIQFICEMTQVHISLVTFSASLLQSPLFFFVGIILPLHGVFPYRAIPEMDIKQNVLGTLGITIFWWFYIWSLVSKMNEFAQVIGFPMWH